MNNDGHVYSVFTMWPLLRRVYQAWAGTLCPQSVLEKARQSETVDGFNLINAPTDESVRAQTQSQYKYSEWTGSI